MMTSLKMKKKEEKGPSATNTLKERQTNKAEGYHLYTRSAIFYTQEFHAAAHAPKVEGERKRKIKLNAL